MSTVTYEGDLAPVVGEFKALNWKSSADGTDFIFDSKKNDWVELNKGDTIVDSDNGYYVGEEEAEAVSSPEPVKSDEEPESVPFLYPKSGKKK